VRLPLLVAALLQPKPAAGAARLATGAASRTSQLLCSSLSVPVPFRPLDQQEIVGKLDAVPVFSVVNRNREMFPDHAKDDELYCRFYLDIGAALRKLSELRAANPGLPLSLAVTPLGTAYALGEWLPVMESTPISSPRRGGIGDVLSGYGGPGEDDDARESADTDGKRIDVELRIVADEAEVEAVSALLEQSPTPALVRRRNRISGPVPLFGSDELRFKAGAGVGAGAAASSLKEEESAGGDGNDVLTPLFLRRSDYLAAWLASGGTDDNLPAAQVSDLRTLVWQMECESSYNWRQVVLVAPQESIDFAVEVERQREAAGIPVPQPPRPMKRVDVQSAIFPADSGVIRDCARR
jgi:hypothetical protein